MADRNARPDLPVILFERTGDVWHAKANTEDGEVVGSGHTILEARTALDKLLRRRAATSEGRL
jgi:hypothetical protein